jgi:NTE family protein
MLSRAMPDASSRVGLALAGGGPEGAVYEIGVLRALDEAIEGIDFTRLPVYVGVSAGAFIAANLANRITTAQNARAIVKHVPGEHPFTSQNFFKPAIGEIVRRGLSAPGLLADSVLAYLTNADDETLVDSLARLSRALPVGVFDNEPIRHYLEKIYSIKGRTDDFRRLSTQLFIVATELDSGRAVRFGEPGYDHIPISHAVQASSALPGLYPPVVIDGRHYVDGVLLKTMHASVALEQGVDLVICVNPIVPVNTLRADHADNLASHGLPTVLSQTFRTMIHSRMTVGMAAYAPRFPAQDLVLFEPQADDYRMFFTNIFSFSSRKAVCEHAYGATRQDLLARYDELAPIFRRHGMTLRRDVLADPDRDLWRGVGIDDTRRNGSPGVTTRLRRALDDLDALLREQERG